MRILCLSNMHPGPRDPDFGAFVKDMAEALRQRGHTVDVVAIDSRGGGRLRSPAKYASLTARALLAARRHDVIYAHFLFPTAGIAALAHRVFGTPWVVTAHGQDVANLELRTLRSATQRALGSCGGVIAVSRYLAERVDTFLDPLPPVDVINMGVDMDRFVIGDRLEARKALGLSALGPLVLAVGGLTSRKDPLNLLQAVARLRRTLPDVSVAFVGDGPLASAVDAGAAALGMGRHVIRPGAIPHDQVGTWIAAADVLSMVSRVEPLGVVTLEALAGGRPVVATARGGAHEVVPTAGPGRVVEPGDPILLADALADLIASPPDPGDCRAAAAAHRLARQAERVEAVLERAMTRPDEDTLMPRGRTPPVIAPGDPAAPDVQALRDASAAYHAALYPAESNHLLPIEALQGPDVTFLVARLHGAAVGCGALVAHGDWGEITSMFVDPATRGSGTGRRLLAALEDAARERGCTTVRLRTGIHQPEAIGLYRAAGYTAREPFGDDAPDPLSLSLEKPL